MKTIKDYKISSLIAQQAQIGTTHIYNQNIIIIYLLI